MSFLINGNYLYLAQTRIEAMNQAFRAREPAHSMTGYALLIIAVICILAALAIVLAVKKRSEHVMHDPKKLFAELCRAHQLSGSQRRLLGEMARVKNLSDPALLMLDAEHWTFDATKEKKLCHPRNRNRLLMLRRLLFSAEKLAS